MSEQILTTDDATETLIDFPCDFDIKVLGLAGEDFIALMLDVIRPHVSSALDDDKLSHRNSSNGKYTSLTVTIWATSKVQLDDIYQALHAHERVKYLL